MGDNHKDHRPTHGWSQVEELRKMEEMAKKAPEPFTVPEGYSPPSMKELWQYVRTSKCISRDTQQAIYLTVLGFFCVSILSTTVPPAAQLVQQQ